MVIWTGFMEGYRERGEQLGRRRRDLAKAFEEFKRNNPTATFQEYQSFIDQYTGDSAGSNYLRGGAPSEDVLRSLSQQNERTRQLQQMESRAAQLRTQGEIQGQIEGLADRALLNMEGDDYDAAYESFINQLGPDAEETYQGMNLRNFFTPSYANRLAARQVRNRMGDIQSYLKMVDPNEIDSQSLAEFTGVRNPSVVEDMLSFARQEAQRLQNEAVTSRRQDMIRDMQATIQAGGSADEAIAAVQATYTDSNGFPLDNELLKPVFEEAKKTYEERKQVEDQERRRAILDRRGRIEDSFSQNPNIQNAIRRGDKEFVTRQMLDIAKDRMLPEDFEATYGVTPDSATPELFSDNYERLLQTVTEDASNEYRTYSDTRTQNLQQNLSTLRTNNVEQTAVRVKDTLGDAPAAIATSLARRYVFDQPTLNAFETIYTELAESGAEMNSAQFEQAIEADPRFAQVANSLDERAELIREANAPLPFRAFSDWHSEFASDIQAVQQDFDKSLANIEGETDLGRAANAVAQMRRQLNNLRQQVAVEIQRARREADVWVKPGTGGFNEAAVSQLQNQAAQVIQNYEDRLSQIETQIEAAREEAEATASASSDSNDQGSMFRYQMPQTTGPGGGARVAQEPPISTWWRNLRENMPANRGDPLGNRQDDQ